jgi:asparagine synthase (glutamine-hydrolysing)
MSIIFGIRKSHGEIVTPEEMAAMAAATRRYASDDGSVLVQGRLGMGFQPYPTHERSHLESQPVLDIEGNVLSFDGRIDNYLELSNLLGMGNENLSDSQIVLESFLRWGESCFSRLIGDWALSLWSASRQVIYLARDHAGTRSLYLRSIHGMLQWSTYLESFFVGETTFPLDESYAARYLSSQEVGVLTPYSGIRAVPPAHYLIVREDRIESEAHWKWMARDQIRYQSDHEYEEQFLHLFGQAVTRRTGPGAPILAQLSGGMDSTSIVCMSDHCRMLRDTSSPVLDTVSFYDDTEPNWNEFPYFSLVEAKRGRVGIHLATSFRDRTFEQIGEQDLYLLPGADSSTSVRENEFLTHLDPREYRVVLSGLGGDELLGGVPTPLPELADHLLSGEITVLLKRAMAWCLVDRTPILHQLLATILFTVDLFRRSCVDATKIPPWIPSTCRKLYQEDADAVRKRPQTFGISPHAISNGLTWWSMIETLPHLNPPFLARLEYRYPYLDRDLVDFLFRIPREQLVRPGRRRSLMRRALAGIVPVEILERRRKAFLVRGPLLALERAKPIIDRLFAESLAVRRGLIDAPQLRKAVNSAVAGSDANWWPWIFKAIYFELWLRANSRRLKGGTL